MERVNNYFIISTLFVLLSCVSFGNTQPVPPLMTRFYLDTVSANAVCNDGTPAAYYFRPGSGSGATRWVIRLQGGGWCWDVASCASREKKYTTSSLCPPSINDTTTMGGSQHQGILSSNPELNPNWYNANQVWLWYCTSDSHVGNKTANTSLNGWAFQGKEVVKSLISSLFSFHSLSSAKEILLTGDSAGGVATINNADFIASLIYPVIPNVHYRAFVDAGFFLDIPAYGQSSFSFQMVAKNLVNYWGAIYDESCVEYYGPGNEWHCFHETLAFYQEFQFDAANLGFDGIGSYPFTAPESTFAYDFQQSMFAATAKVPYMFLPNCFIHETIDQAYFSDIKISNVSISQALWNWYTDTTQPPADSHTIDPCIQTINCNPSCPALSK